jgi:hypothetical protein
MTNGAREGGQMAPAEKQDSARYLTDERSVM